MFTIDISDVLALEAEALESLEVRQPREMKSILDVAARETVAQRGYTNRTGDLSASTFASEDEDSSGDVSIELAARVEYASYVQNLGLMPIEEMADAAEAALAGYFADEAAKLGR